METKAGVLVLLLAASTQVAAADDADRVRKWIVKLQDSKTSERLKAVQELRKLGATSAPAVPGLLTAAKDADPKVRSEAEAALGNLTGALVALATTHADPATRTEAVTRIHGDAALEEVARNAPADTARAAFLRIQSPAILAALARSGPADLRPLATGKLSDPDLLAELARTGSAAVRDVALRPPGGSGAAG